MIDHTGVVVSNIARSISFYTAALKPIGYEKLLEFTKEVTGSKHVAGFGEKPKADFWLAEGVANEPRVHVAFRVGSKNKVDEYYKAALAAGGRDNGAPGPRPHYHENYYGAFVLDPDGHNIEVVYHGH